MKKVKSEYDIQAETFLKDTETTLTALYTGHRSYFPGDKEHRATFQITLTNKRGVYSFQFGQSIADSYGIGIGARRRIPQQDYNHPTVISAQRTGQEETYYPQRQGGKPPQRISLNKRVPSAYDVLACLTTYDPETFDDFCDNYGYSNDSRQAETTWRAVIVEFRGLCKIFTTEEMEQLSEIN